MAFDPISANDSPGLLYETTSVSSVNWKLAPPELFFYWMMNFNAPKPFNESIKIPDFTALPEYASFTDWLFEVEMQHTYTYFFTTTDSIPFCKVYGDFTYSGNLGVLADGFYTKILNFSFANLNMLSEGQYYATAKCKVTALNPASGLREIISTKDLLMQFNANAFTYALAPPFEVTYQGKGLDALYQLTPFIFNYVVGNPVPDTQELFYFVKGANNNTNTAAPTILNPSDAIIEATYAAVHSYFAKVNVGFGAGITALPEGIHDFTLQIGILGFGTVPDNSIQVPIRLHVLPAAVGDLSVDPEELNYTATIGGPNADPQTFYVYSTGYWNVVSEVPSWLLLSFYEGVGTTFVQANVYQYFLLAPGTYTHQLMISDGINTVTIDITFVVLGFLTHPFVPGKLFFTKELDYISVSSANANTYLELTLNITVFENSQFASKSYERVYELPLMNGAGKFHVGTIVHQLFEEISKLQEFAPSVNENYVALGYLPAEITVDYEEKKYPSPVFEVITLTSGQIQTFKMIKGWKPYITENNLSLLTVKQQELTRITVNSIISTSFSHFGNPQIIVKRNNIVIENFTAPSFPAASGSPKVLFNYFRFINDLRVGDLVEIFVINGTEVRSSKFSVHPMGIESTHILFENNNGMIESFELTGRRRAPIGYEFIKKTKYVDLFEVETKARAKSVQGLIINSGKLLPSDFRIIDQIIKSDNVWLAFDSIYNRFIKVDAINSKITPEDTFSNENAFDLEFNILENSYAQVYPE